MINRREFLGLSVAGGMMPEMWTHDWPVFSVGIMTDTHVSPDPRTFKRVRKAYELFKDQRVDMIANVGDIADHFYPEAYRRYRDISLNVFPARNSAPKEVFCFDNHDWYAYPRPDDREHSKCYAEVRELLGIEHEQYDRFKLAGFNFLVFPLSHDRRFTEMIEAACRDTPDRPVFVFDHVPPSDTTYGTAAGGGSAQTRMILERFPNVVHISGHTHGSLRNEAMIWQGGFTCVNAGSLTYFGDYQAGTDEDWGQNSSVLVLRIFENRAEFHRYSLVDGSEISPDRLWTITWPKEGEERTEESPYAPENHYQRMSVPQYIEGSGIRTVLSGDQIRLQLPTAVDRRDLHQHRLVVEHLEGEEWRVVVIQHSRGDYWCERNDKPRREMILDRLLFADGGRFRFTLTPVGFLGACGLSLTREFQIPEYAPLALWRGMPEGFVKGEWRQLGNSHWMQPGFLPQEDRKWAKIAFTISVKDAPGAMLQFKTGTHWPPPTAQIPNGADRLRFVLPVPRISLMELLSLSIGNAARAKIRFDDFAIYPCPVAEGDEWSHGMVNSFRAGDGVH